MSTSFQFSPPRRGRPGYRLAHSVAVLNFNSRPRVGGVSNFVQMKSAVYVQYGGSRDYKLLPKSGLQANLPKTNRRFCTV